VRNGTMCGASRDRHGAAPHDSTICMPGIALLCNGC
jgi:hypothetical protein